MLSLLYLHRMWKLENTFFFTWTNTNRFKVFFLLRFDTTFVYFWATGSSLELSWVTAVFQGAVASHRSGRGGEVNPRPRAPPGQASLTLEIKTLPTRVGRPDRVLLAPSLSIAILKLTLRVQQDSSNFNRWRQLNRAKWVVVFKKWVQITWMLHWSYYDSIFFQCIRK